MFLEKFSLCELFCCMGVVDCGVGGLNMDGYG